MKKAKQASQKKRAKKKKSFFFFHNLEQAFGFCFFIIVIGLSCWVIATVKDWVNNPERVVLSQLTITGDRVFTTEDDVQRTIIGLGLPNTYIAQNVDDIQQEIMRLPWIKQVSVRKQWPDRLIVHLVEYQADYVWNETFLLDKQGVVFRAPQDKFNTADLIKLFGPVDKEKFVLDIFNKLNQVSQTTSSKEMMIKIKQATADERNAWQLVVNVCVKKFCNDNQNIKLTLGRENIIERYKRFIRFYPDIQSEIKITEKIIEADLRYENGISVKKNN